jgi:hypothetical protein
MDVPEELRALSYRLVHDRELMLDVARRNDAYRAADDRARSAVINDLAMRAMRSLDEANRWVLEIRKVYG